ncbi:glycosyltransferase family 61 protein [Chitinophaga deserti]|uniref:glycosyltransferase family 61 protein n=1 Tax=Chitinophaga deserti TaxID=2164099 RepID=UPI0013009241|nr:glycosyltransferase family 61 protein [Chitinophaga deserti]
MKNAAIVKNSIFNPARFRFENSYAHILSISAFAQFRKLYLYLLPGKRIDRAIWISDEWSAEYYHWLSDALPRLIAVENLRHSHVVLLPERYREKPYVEQSLQLLGFRWEYYNITRIVRVRELVSSAHTAPTGLFHKPAILALRNRMRLPALIANRKIYISRKKAVRRHILNEESVMNLVISMGYEVHFFEDYDLVTQIKLMSETRFLIGLHGAGLTNMLFMPEAGSVLELRRENETHFNCFYHQAIALHHHYYNLQCHTNTDDTHIADFTVNGDALKKAIIQMEADIAKFIL